MKCNQLRSELALVAFGLGRDEKSDEWTDHLHQCERCERELSKLKELILVGDSEPVTSESEDQLWSVISARIDVEGEDSIEEKVAAPLVIGLTCTYCHDLLPRFEARYCGSCLAPHHGDCFRLYGRCATLGCDETRVVQATVEEPVRQARGAQKLFPWLGVMIVVGGAAAFTGAKLTRDFLIETPQPPVVAVKARGRRSEIPEPVAADIDDVNARLAKVKNEEEFDKQRSLAAGELAGLAAAEFNLKEAKEIIQSLETEQFGKAIAHLNAIPKKSKFAKEARAWRDFVVVEQSINKAREHFASGERTAALEGLSKAIKNRVLTKDTRKRVENRIEYYKSIDNSLQRISMAFKGRDYKEAKRLLQAMMLNSELVGYHLKLVQELLRSLGPDMKRVSPSLHPDVVTGWRWKKDAFQLYWTPSSKNRFVQPVSRAITRLVRNGGPGVSVGYFTEAFSPREEEDCIFRRDCATGDDNYEIIVKARFLEALKPYFDVQNVSEFKARRSFSMKAMKRQYEKSQKQNQYLIEGCSIVGGQLDIESITCMNQSLEFKLKAVGGSYSVLDKIEVFRRVVGEKKYTQLLNMNPEKGTSFKDTTAESGTVYQYLIRAKSLPDLEHPVLRKIRDLDATKVLVWELELGPVKMFAVERD